MHADPIVHASRHTTGKEQVMSEPVTFKATLGAWLTYGEPDRLLEHVSKGAYLKAADMLSYGVTDMTSHGWVRVGDAEVTVTLIPRSEQVAAAVAVLQAELQTERAEAMRRQNAILDRIGKLQAITYEAA